jgi:drug/metabolite transporter (DMT)-like permease
LGYGVCMSTLHLLLLVGIMAISTAPIFIKLCPAPALIIAAYRMLFASLMIAPLAIHRRAWSPWSRREMGWLILSGLSLSLHFTFFIGSLKYTSVASSVVLANTNPLFVGLGGWLFLRERLQRNLVLGILFSVAGGSLIGVGDMGLSRDALFGDGLALLGAIMASVYFLAGRKMREHQDLLSYIFPVYSVAGLVLVLFSVIARQSFFIYSTSTYFYLFLLALIPQLIGHSSFNWALKYLPASMVAIAVLGETIGSTLLAYFILGEGLTLLKVIGAGLIFVGILVALRSQGTPLEGKKGS